MSDELLPFLDQLINDHQEAPEDPTNDINKKFPQVQGDPNVLFETITSFFNDNYQSDDWKNVNAAISSLIYLCQPLLRESDPKPENFFEFLLYVIPECLIIHAGDQKFSLRTKDSALWIIGQLLIAYPEIVENLDISSLLNLSIIISLSTDPFFSPYPIIFKRASFLLSVLAKNPIISSSENFQGLFTDFAQEVFKKIESIDNENDKESIENENDKEKKKLQQKELIPPLFSALNSFIPSIQNEELISFLFDRIYQFSGEIAYQSSISNLASSFFMRSPNLDPLQIVQHATFLLCFIRDTIGASPEYFSDDFIEGAFCQGPAFFQEYCPSYSVMYNMICQNTFERKLDPDFNAEVWKSALIALLNLFSIGTPYFIYFSFPLFTSLVNAFRYQDQDQPLKYLAIRGFVKFFEIVDKTLKHEDLKPEDAMLFHNKLIEVLLSQFLNPESSDSIGNLTVQFVFPETQDRNEIEIGVMIQIIENLLYTFTQVLENDFYLEFKQILEKDGLLALKQILDNVWDSELNQILEVDEYSEFKQILEKVVDSKFKHIKDAIGPTEFKRILDSIGDPIFKRILEKVYGDDKNPTFIHQLSQYFFIFIDKIYAFLKSGELDKVDRKQATTKILNHLFLFIKTMGKKYKSKLNVQIVLHGLKFVELVKPNLQFDKPPDSIFNQNDEIYSTAQKFYEAMQQF